MLKKSITVAVLSAFVLAAAPSFAQNTQNQAGQGNSDQMTPGAAPSDNAGTQKPQKSKKKKQGANAGAQTGNSDSHPGNTNQTGVPSTQPGGTGTQSGANPAGAPDSSQTNGGTTR